MWVQSGERERVARSSGGIAVLLNANARRVSPRVMRAVEKVIPRRDIYLSRTEKDAGAIADQVVERGYPTVFLGGGDGTVTRFLNEILDRVAQRKAAGLPALAPSFGVLKLGTGNSVASLVEADDEEIVNELALATVGQVGRRSVDLLRVEGRRAPFAGLGLDGQLLNDYLWVRQRMGQGPLGKLLSGAGGYATSVALRTLPYYLTHSTAVDCEVVNGRGTAYRMGKDGAPVETFAPGSVLYRGSLMMAAAGTVPFYGFELKMFPFAGHRRGMMDLRLGTLPPATILANLGKLWSGTWFPDGLKDYLTEDVTIHFSRPMPFQVAGDAEGHRDRVHFEVAGEPVEVLQWNRSGRAMTAVASDGALAA